MNQKESELGLAPTDEASLEQSAAEAGLPPGIFKDPKSTMTTIEPGYIETYSGKIISIFDPQPEDIDLEDIAHALAHQCRFNGHVSRIYTIAEHSLLVANLCPRDQRREGLMHDASEAYVGDLITPLKRELPGFQGIEDRFHALIAEKYNLEFPHSHAVRLADLQALWLERRQLRTGSLDSIWPVFESGGFTPPYDLRIPEFAPAEAKLRFLSQARRYGLS